MAQELTIDQPLQPAELRNEPRADRQMSENRASEARTSYVLPPAHPIIRRAERRALRAVKGTRTISRNVVKHIAGFAFEELVWRTARFLAGPAANHDDSQTHDIRIAGVRFELKCRHTDHGDVRGAIARDFDVKVNQYNEAWQTPDYYVFGFCSVHRGRWYFDILGYREAEFIKRPEHLIAKGADIWRGDRTGKMNAPAYVVRISQLHTPQRLVEHIVDLAQHAVVEVERV